MKSEIPFGLENAAWPALLISDDGTIRRANRVAEELFGGAVRSEKGKIHAIWSATNVVSFRQWCGENGRFEHPSPVEFTLPNGSIRIFAPQVCMMDRDDQTYWMLQLFEQDGEGEPAPASGKVSKAAAGAAAASGPSGKGKPLTAGEGAVEASIAHKQKLDCALQLARSVALDFNNALTSILGHASLLLGKSEPEHPWRSSLVEIEKSAARAAEVAQDLASFSRQEKDTKVQRAGNLNAVLERCVDLFRGSESAAVNWSLHLERKLFTVNFDEAKIQQAVVKVLENAVQAAGAEGRIVVTTRNLELSAPTQDRTVRLNAGNYVSAEIADNGPGIPADVLPRIFEPFFTTKKGNHRGLGLAFVYGIVTNHGGGVAVSSEGGVGATVRLYFPANKKVVRNISSGDDLSGSQTILIVDDEDLLLTMGQMILGSFGYEVLTANNGQRALEIISGTKKKIDLLVTDLVMPQMSGRELIEHVQQVSPATRILCTSGYVRASSPEDSELYLQKPFTAQDLLRKVKEAFSTHPA